MRTLASLLLILALAPPAAWAYESRDADFSDAELDRLLAPIALYPDSVLTHVLIAATYPLEIVEAARWSRRHPDLRGEEAVAAAADRDWDASVKALVAFPELLARMDEDLEWTQDLGDAFLAHEARLADRVQYLRQRAYENGHLDALEHVHVIREPEVIYIEPAVTHIVHVPFYDTRIVYGSWWWPAYPPVYWAYPFYGSVWYWGAGYHIAPSFYFSAWHWPTRRVVVVNHVHHHHHFGSARQVAVYHDARKWRHDNVHRRGVHYRHERVRTEYASARPARPDRSWTASRNADRRDDRADRFGDRADRREDRAADARADRAGREDRADRQTGTRSSERRAGVQREAVRRDQHRADAQRSARSREFAAFRTEPRESERRPEPGREARETRPAAPREAARPAAPPRSQSGGAESRRQARAEEGRQPAVREQRPAPAADAARHEQRERSRGRSRSESARGDDGKSRRRDDRR